MPVALERPANPAAEGVAAAISAVGLADVFLVPCSLFPCQGRDISQTCFCDRALLITTIAFGILKRLRAGASTSLKPATYSCPAISLDVFLLSLSFSTRN
jgi:hypothetical protein